MKNNLLCLALVLGVAFTAAAQETKVKTKTTNNGVTTTEVQETEHNKTLGRETTKTTNRTTTQSTPETVQKVEEGGSKVGSGVKKGAKKTGSVAKKGAKKVASGTKKGAKEVVEHTPGTDANKERKAAKAE